MRAYDRQFVCGAMVQAGAGAAWAGHSYVVGVVMLELISTASHYMRLLKFIRTTQRRKKKGPLISDLWLCYFSIKRDGMVLVSINRSGKTSALVKGIVDLCELQAFCTWFYLSHHQFSFVQGQIPNFQLLHSFLLFILDFLYLSTSEIGMYGFQLALLVKALMVI